MSALARYIDNHRSLRVLLHRLGMRPHFYKWSDIKAERSGGTAPRCVYCGRAAR